MQIYIYIISLEDLHNCAIGDKRLSQLAKRENEYCDFLHQALTFVFPYIYFHRITIIENYRNKVAFETFSFHRN